MMIVCIGESVNLDGKGRYFFIEVSALYFIIFFQKNLIFFIAF